MSDTPPPSDRYVIPQLRLLNPASRSVEPSAGDIACSQLQVREIDQDARAVRAVVSTGNVDRYQEIVEPKAFAKWLKHFEANPVMLAAHDHSAWASGEPTVIGRWTDLSIQDDGLHATGQFMPDDDLAERYWRRYRDGFMRAFSVGFLAHRWEMREMSSDDGATKRLRVFTEVELLEISAVAVPANRQALSRAASLLAGGSTHDQDSGLRGLDQQISDRLDKLFAADGPVLKLAAERLQRELDCRGLDDFYGDEQPDPAPRGFDQQPLIAELRAILGNA